MILTLALDQRFIKQTFMAEFDGWFEVISVTVPCRLWSPSLLAITAEGAGTILAQSFLVLCGSFARISFAFINVSAFYRLIVHAIASVSRLAFACEGLNVCRDLAHITSVDALVASSDVGAVGIGVTLIVSGVQAFIAVLASYLGAII